jgi:hypothetical protein
LPTRCAAFAALGLEHVMVEFAPYTPAALDRFTDAVHRFRERAPG